MILTVHHVGCTVRIQITENRSIRLFITSRVDLEEEGHELFLPFRTEAQVRKEGKGILEKWKKKGAGASSSMELGFMLFCLRKLHSGYYMEEIDKMGISREDMVKTIGGDILEKVREEGLEKGMEKGFLQKSRADLLRILKARFGAVGEAISKKVEGMDSIEQLDTLIEKAATCSSLEDFEKGMEA